MSTVENPLNDDWGGTYTGENPGDPDLEWGDYKEDEGGGWNNDEKEIYSIGSLYIIYLNKNEKRKKPFLCKCIAIVNEDNTIHFEDENEFRTSKNVGNPPVVNPFILCAVTVGGSEINLNNLL